MRGWTSSTRGAGERLVVGLALVASLAACVPTPAPPGERLVDQGAPERIRIVPDDFHVPFAGTAGDGRRFFLSAELFDPGGSEYVGLFLWTDDGAFDELLVDEVPAPPGSPADDAARAEADRVVEGRLAELGGYVLEPIDVEPFARVVDGVTFGWVPDRYADGTVVVTLQPGDAMAYTAPWDGLGYDT